MERVLGAEHPDTTVSAFNLFVTLVQMEDGEEGRRVLEEDLMWLFEAEEARLSGDQRTVRDELRELGRQ